MTTKDVRQRTHEVVEVPIDDLRPDPANPRRISDAAARSADEEPARVRLRAASPGPP